MKKNLIIICFLLTFSCHKEKNVIYELNDVIIQQNDANKEHLKSTTEFISIAYSDVFGKVISSSKLHELTQSYNSFGDKILVEEMIIKNFLSEPTFVLPDIDRSSDLTIKYFVTDTYKKLFNRLPDEYELWFVADMIKDDVELNAELIYFSLMSSIEYRYY